MVSLVFLPLQKPTSPNSNLAEREDPDKNQQAVLSVRFEVGVSLLLALTGADKRGPKAPFPLVENAGIQLVICKRVPAGALAGAGSC